MTDVSGLTLYQKSDLIIDFDEGLGSKRQSYLYSLVLEFFLCYSLFEDLLKDCLEKAQEISRGSFLTRVRFLYFKNKQLDTYFDCHSWFSWLPTEHNNLAFDSASSGTFVAA